MRQTKELRESLLNEVEARGHAFYRGWYLDVSLDYPADDSPIRCDASVTWRGGELTYSLFGADADQVLRAVVDLIDRVTPEL